MKSRHREKTATELCWICYPAFFRRWRQRGSVLWSRHSASGIISIPVATMARSGCRYFSCALTRASPKDFFRREIFKFRAKDMKAEEGYPVITWQCLNVLQPKFEDCSRIWIFRRGSKHHILLYGTKSFASIRFFYEITIYQNIYIFAPLFQNNTLATSRTTFKKEHPMSKKLPEDLIALMYGRNCYYLL